MRLVKQRLSSTRLADGTEIAYALVGQGPLMVHAPGWLTHLEFSWALPAERGFYEMLARGRTLVRYDNPGCGLSGPTARALSFELEVEALEAVVASATSTADTDAVELFGASLGSAVAASLAASQPRRVSRLVLYGGWVRGSDLASAEIRQHVLGLISQHWGLGSDVLADIFAPSADPATRTAFTRYQREAAQRRPLAGCWPWRMSSTSPISSRALRAHPGPASGSGSCGAAGAGPSLGRGDPGRAPGGHGRSRPLAVHRRRHLVGHAHQGFPGLPPLRDESASTLTTRQQQVARLVSQGLTNREIAAELTITERSAESHVERIRDRLGFRSRSQLAAWYSAGGR